MFPWLRLGQPLKCTGGISRELSNSCVPPFLMNSPTGYDAYCRGLAHLGRRSGKEAAEEFQKLLDNRGLLALSPYWGLAHLGLARAYAMSGDTDKARAMYREFLALWKDADADIPIFRQAKEEYAKLK